MRAAFLLMAGLNAWCVFNGIKTGHLGMAAINAAAGIAALVNVVMVRR